MIKLGITGGIGSGKSVVCDIFRIYNIPVYNADKEAKALNDNSPAVREGLIKSFGSSIYKDGKLDRKRFASLIFNNEQNLNTANSIIHPEVANSFLEWCQKQINKSIVIIDAAILFEAGFDKYVDKVITVTSPFELRIERVIKRDNSDYKKVRLRMDKQSSDEEKIIASDWMILNDEKKSLIKQVSDILKELSDAV